MKNEFGIKLDRNGYAPSIMQDEEECFFSGTTIDVTRHEVFFGNGKRQLSKKYGCWIWVCNHYHNQLHVVDSKLCEELKKKAQIEFESLYGHDKFMRIFGKNYL